MDGVVTWECLLNGLILGWKSSGNGDCPKKVFTYKVLIHAESGTWKEEKKAGRMGVLKSTWDTD